jgi:hypothetical protein
VDLLNEFGELAFFCGKELVCSRMRALPHPTFASYLKSNLQSGSSIPIDACSSIPIDTCSSIPIDKALLFMSVQYKSDVWRHILKNISLTKIRLGADARLGNYPFYVSLFTTFSDGCLGSNNDEGRSEV